MGGETEEDVTLSMSIPKMVVALQPVVKAGEQALEQPPKDLKKTVHLPIFILGLMRSGELNRDGKQRNAAELMISPGFFWAALW